MDPLVAGARTLDRGGDVHRIARRIVRSAASELDTIRRWRRARPVVRRAELLAGHGGRVEWIGDAGELTNPSITGLRDRTVVLARTVTYRLSRLRQRAIPLSVRVEARTLLVQGRERPVVLKERDASPDEHLEDPRAFEWRGGLWALWSRSRELGPGLYSNSMVLAEVVDGATGPLLSLPSPHGRVREKNWMPLVDGDRLRFVYDLSTMETYEHGEEGLRLVHRESQEIPALRRHSGSSQFVRHRDAWIGVSHRNAMRPRTMPWLPYAYYWHHIVVLNDDLSLRAVSRPFFFRRRGVEYCAGLTVDRDHLVFSFGVDDARAALMRLPLANLGPLFRPATAGWFAS